MASKFNPPAAQPQKLLINTDRLPRYQITSTFTTSSPPPLSNNPRPPSPPQQPGAAMGACATKPKTLEGKAPAEAKVAPETTVPTEVMMHPLGNFNLSFISPDDEQLN